MIINVMLPGNGSKVALFKLRSYLESACIDGMESIAVEATLSKKGEMGTGDVLDSIRMIIHAAEKPLVELVKCLLKYVENYRTVISIPTKSGNIELKHGRSMTAEQLKEIVTAIQRNLA